MSCLHRSHGRGEPLVPSDEIIVSRRQFSPKICVTLSKLVSATTTKRGFAQLEMGRLQFYVEFPLRANLLRRVFERLSLR